jgi:hypothetical protein
MIGLVNNELKQMWKAVARANFEGNLMVFACGTEENHEAPQIY